MDKEDKIKQLIVDCKGTFGTEEGKRVLKRLSKECYEHRNTFVLGDQYATAFNEGKRYVILYICDLIEKDPNKVRQTETITKGKNDGR